MWEKRRTHIMNTCKSMFTVGSDEKWFTSEEWEEGSRQAVLIHEDLHEWGCTWICRREATAEQPKPTGITVNLMVRTQRLLLFVWLFLGNEFLQKLLGFGGRGFKEWALNLPLPTSPQYSKCTHISDSQVSMISMAKSPRIMFFVQIIPLYHRIMGC